MTMKKTTRMKNSKTKKKKNKLGMGLVKAQMDLLKSKAFIVFLVFVWILPADANQELTPRQMKRVKEVRRLLADVEKRSLPEIIDELQQTSKVEGNLKIMEAVATVYDELVQDYELQEFEAKERLLEKVRMNMAYFQLGGLEIRKEQGSDLNRLIRRKLKQHLSEELTSDAQLFHSLEEWE